jgi:hypothetical protein
MFKAMIKAEKTAAEREPTHCRDRSRSYHPCDGTGLSVRKSKNFDAWRVLREEEDQETQ